MIYRNSTKISDTHDQDFASLMLYLMRWEKNHARILLKQLTVVMIKKYGEIALKIETNRIATFFKWHSS